MKKINFKRVLKKVLGFSVFAIICASSLTPFAYNNKFNFQRHLFADEKPNSNVLEGSDKLEDYDFSLLNFINPDQKLGLINLHNLYDIGNNSVLFAKNKNLNVFDLNPYLDPVSVTPTTQPEASNSENTTSSSESADNNNPVLPAENNNQAPNNQADPNPSTNEQEAPDNSEVEPEPEQPVVLEKDKNVNSVVFLNKNTNNIDWAINSHKVLDSIINFRKQYVKTNGHQLAYEDGKVENLNTNLLADRVVYNKVFYSAAASSFYLSVYTFKHEANDPEILTGEDKATGHLSLLKLNLAQKSVSVYFDAWNQNKMISSGGAVFKNRNFANAVIDIDNSSNPRFLFSTAIFKNKENYKNFYGFNARSSVSATGVFPANLDANDLNFINTAGKNNQIIATNAIWQNSGLILITQRKTSDYGLTNVPKTYNFSLNGGTFQNPSTTSLSVVSPNKQTFFEVWYASSGTYLMGVENNSLSADFSSTGKILLQRIRLNVQGNNANLELTKFEKNIKYFNQANTNSIVNAYNSNQLPSNTTYVAVNKNKVLVALNSNFDYLGQIALVDTIPEGVEILKMAKTGTNYLLYLSNGNIVAYNNAGFVGYVKNLNNSLESITPISFKNQETVENGASWFSLSEENFKTKIRLNPNTFFNISKVYNNLEPKLLYKFTTKPAPQGADYSSVLNVQVFQELRHPKPGSKVITADSPVLDEVFLGENEYHLYNKPIEISVKSFNSLKAFLKNNNAANVAAFYSKPQNHKAVLEDLINLRNVNLKDLYLRDQKNYAVNVTANNAEGTVNIRVSFNSLWINRGGAPVRSSTLQSYNFSIRGFRVSSNTNVSLTYKVNPKKTNEINRKFLNISPSELKEIDLLNNFIEMSPYLQNLTKTTTITPNDVEGNATITIKFNNLNPEVKLPKNPGTILVTDDSITWKTLDVFKKSPNINQAVLLKFNTTGEISEKNPGIILSTPSQIKNQLDNARSKSDKLNLVINNWHFITVSEAVKKNINSIEITEDSDLNGTFDLTVNLSVPFENTLRTSYKEQYSGFAKKPLTNEDVFKISFLDKEKYITEFGPKDNQNIFNLIPSLIHKDDLVIRNGTDLSKTNGVLGGLISINAVAQNSPHTISLIPNDANGTLLVSIIFRNFVEINKESSQVEQVSNKRFVKIFDKFKKSGNEETQNNSDLYYLNWKDSDYWKANLSSNESDKLLEKLSNIATVTPSDYALEVENLAGEPIFKEFLKLNLFSVISPDAFEKYKVDQGLIKVDLIPDNLKGTLTVQIQLGEWNHSTKTATFEQKFSGFKIDEDQFKKEVETFNPFNNEKLNEFKIEALKGKTKLSDLTPEQLALFFSFQGSVLNEREKRIFFVYNENNGKGIFLVFVKNAIENKESTKVVKNLASKYKILHEDKPATDKKTGTEENKDENNVNFDLSKIPFDQLEKEGFVELKQSRKIVEGFQVVKKQAEFSQSILSLSLSIIIPFVAILVIVTAFLFVRRYPIVRFTKWKIEKRLADKLKKDKRSQEE